jgi:hypothetical protein
MRDVFEQDHAPRLALLYHLLDLHRHKSASFKSRIFGARLECENLIFGWHLGDYFSQSKKALGADVVNHVELRQNQRPCVVRRLGDRLIRVSVLLVRLHAVLVSLLSQHCSLFQKACGQVVIVAHTDQLDEWRVDQLGEAYVPGVDRE